jgi:hypothetical protein
MTTQRTAGSKASARQGKAALEQWARRQLSIARKATARAVEGHLAAGRAVVFEKDGRLFRKESAAAKARPLPDDALSAAGFAESETPKYTKAPKNKSRRAKSR